MNSTNNKNRNALSPKTNKSSKSRRTGFRKFSGVAINNVTKTTARLMARAAVKPIPLPRKTNLQLRMFDGVLVSMARDVYELAKESLPEHEIAFDPELPFTSDLTEQEARVFFSSKKNILETAVLNTQNRFSMFEVEDLDGEETTLAVDVPVNSLSDLEFFKMCTPCKSEDVMHLMPSFFFPGEGRITHEPDCIWYESPDGQFFTLGQREYTGEFQDYAIPSGTTESLMDQTGDIPFIWEVRERFMKRSKRNAARELKREQARVQKQIEEEAFQLAEEFIANHDHDEHPVLHLLGECSVKDCQRRARCEWCLKCFRHCMCSEGCECAVTRKLWREVLAFSASQLCNRYSPLGETLHEKMSRLRERFSPKQLEDLKTETTQECCGEQNGHTPNCPYHFLTECSFSPEIRDLLTEKMSGPAQGLIPNIPSSFMINGIPDNVSIEHLVEIPILKQLVDWLNDFNATVNWLGTVKEIAFFFAHLQTSHWTWEGFKVSLAHLLSNLECVSIAVLAARGHVWTSIKEYVLGMIPNAEGPAEAFQVLSTAITCVTVLVSAVCVGKLPATKDVDTFISRFSRVGNMITSVQKLTGVAEEMQKLVVGFAKKTIFGYDDDDLKEWKQIDEWCDEVKSLNRIDTEARMATDAVLRSKVDGLIARGHDISVYLSNMRIPLSQKPVIQSCCLFLSRLRQTAAGAAAGEVRSRLAPAIIHLIGESGVGKSSLLDYLNYCLLASMGHTKRNDLNEKVYYRNIASEFWDGFRQDTEIVVYDDFGSKKDMPGAPSNEFLEIIRSANTAPYSLNMASLIDKGYTMFEAKAMILTSNREHFSVETLTNGEAVTNRVSLRVRVEPKPEYAKRKNVDGRVIECLDYEKLTEDAKTNPDIMFDCWRFHVLSNEGTAPYQITRFNLDFQQFADLAVETVSKRTEAGMARLENVNTFYDRFIAQEPLTGPEQSGVEPDIVEYPLQPLTVHRMPLSIIASKASLAFQYFWDSCKAEENVMTNRTMFFYQPNAFFRHMGAPCHVDVETTMRFEATGITKFHELDPEMVANYLETADIPKCVIVPYWGVAELRKVLAHYYGLNLKARMEGVEAIPYALPEWARVCHHHHNSDVEFGDQPVFQRPTFVESAKFVYTNRSFTGLFKNIRWQNVFKVAIDLGFFSLVAYCFYRMVKKVFKRYIQKKEEDVVEEIGATNSEGPYGRHSTAKQHVEGPYANHTTQKQRVEGPYANHTTQKQRVEGTEESFSDQNAAEIRQRVYQNMYLIQTRASDDCVWSSAGTVTIIQGRVGLTNRHIINALRDQVRLVGITAVNAAPKVYTFLRTDLVTYSIPDDDVVYGKRDVAVCEFPRMVHIHRDVFNYFMTKEDFSNHTRLSQVCLVGFDRAGVLKERCTDNCKAEHHVEFDLTDNANVRRQIRGFYVHGAQTTFGDCGSLMVAFDRSFSRKICGIHMAGYESGSYNGAAVAVHQELLGVLLDRLPIRFSESRVDRNAEAFVPPEFSLEGDVVKVHNPVGGNFVYLGKAQMKVHANNVTKIRPSVIHGVTGPIMRKPAHLKTYSRDGVTFDPMAIALKKAATPAVRTDPQILAAATNDVSQMVTECAHEVDRRTLSFEEAICGIVGDEYYQPINRSTSPGYGWDKKGKGKTKWLGEDDYVLDNPEFLEAYHRAIGTLQDGKPLGHYWTDTLKDELRPIEKVDAGKTRQFSCGEMVQTVLLRKYFMGFAAHMARNRILVESCVGVNPYSTDWGRIAEKLRRHGPAVIAGDFSNYDGTLPAEVLWAVLDVINDFYGGSEEDRKIRSLLWIDIVNSCHVVGEDVYLWDHSQPSGCPITSILNSTLHSIVFRYVFILCARKYAPSLQSMNNFRSHVAHINYGDDDVSNISMDIISWFNQETITEAFLQLGMVYTDELKTGEIVKFRKLSDVQFLKRKFVWDSTECRWKAPLDINVVCEMSSFVRGSDNASLAAQTLQQALYELAQHDQATWDEKIPLFKKAIQILAEHHVSCRLQLRDEYLSEDAAKYFGINNPVNPGDRGPVSLAERHRAANPAQVAL